MPNPVLTMEKANLYCGAAPTDTNASNHLTITELKLPGLDEQYTDHRPGGAPVAIEIDTIIARLESTFVLVGLTPQVMELVGSWDTQQNLFFAYGVIRDRQSGEAAQAIAVMKGRLGRADPQNWQRGNVLHTQFSIRGIVHYELAIAGEQIYYWDFFNNQFVVGGVDRNADANALLATGAVATPTPLINPGIIPGTGTVG
jgi:hypothetical protein